MGEPILSHREVPFQMGTTVPRVAKGKQVNIPAPGYGLCAATQMNAETAAGAPGRVLFSS